jgi:hypothetical protein
MSIMLTRRLRGAASFLLVSCLVSSLGCAGGENVTSASLDRARKVWERAGIRDYDLEWTSTGSSISHYQVAVRAGKVRSIGMVQPDGRVTPAHPAQPRFYGVEGLFLTIAEELAQLDTPMPFGQPKGTKAILRFTPDPKLGYPRSYRRDVLGSRMAWAIDVIKFVPDPPRTGTDPSP